MQTSPVNIKLIILLFLILGIAFHTSGQNLLISELSGHTSEGGNSATFTIGLDIPATEAISVTIASQNTSEITIDNPLISFAIDESNPITITITGVDDNVADGNQDVLINITPSTTGIPIQITATNDDNEIADFTIPSSPLTIVEGNSGSFSVVLTAQPASNVVFSFSSDDPEAASVPVTPITFTTDNWNTPQEIFVSGEQDDDLSNETVSVTVSVVNADSDDLFDNLSKNITVNVTDNDLAGYTVSATDLTITEGESGTFTVVLSARPGSPVSIDLLSNNEAAALVTPTSLTFNNADWNVEQTVTVSGQQDENLLNESATITASVNASSDASFVSLPDQLISITVNDNDAADFTIPSSPLTIVEGNSGSFSVVLTAQPASNVVFSFSSDDPEAASVPVTPITFTTDNWNTPQQVIVTGEQDDDLSNETVSVTVSVVNADSDDLFDDLSKNITVNITDNDLAGYTVSATDLTITEGESGTFTVVLSARPGSPVSIDLLSNNEAAALVTPTSLTFNNADWNVEQTVTVSGQQDDNLLNESATITASVNASSDVSFVSLPDQLISITVNDNDAADFTIPSSPLTIVEGNSGSFSVVLTTQPASNVVFSFSSDDPEAASVPVTPITFTTDNWNTPQQVIVTGEQDDDLSNETVSVTVSVVNADSDDLFDDLSKNITVNITDNDLAGYTVSATDLTITEGESGTFTVVLSARPGSPVSIDLLSNNEAAALVTPTSLTFNNSDWNVEQTVTVSGQQDDNLLNESATITASVNASSDASFVSLPDQLISITVNDNDAADFTIPSSPLTIVEGNSGSFSVVLTAQPASNVVFSFSSDDPEAASVPVTPITFTTDNWNTPQQVIVTGEQDDDLNNETVSLKVSVVNADSDDLFDDLSKNITVNITDNDLAGYTVSATDLTITEGESGTFTVVLSARPGSPVSIDLLSNNEAAALVTPTSLTFNNADWNVEQTVTVSGQQDDNLLNESATITASVNASSDASFVSLPDQLISITVNDNDAADFTIPSSPLTIVEGNSGSFSVVLTAQPASNVVFSFSSDDPEAASVPVTPITFTTDNWNTPQQVIVTGVQDDDLNNETVSLKVSVVNEISDDQFDNLSKNLTVNITDNDSPGFALSSNSTNLTEGQNNTITIVLTSQPNDPVSIDLVSNNPDALQINPTNLTFNSTNWNLTQTINLEALHDNDLNPEIVTVTASINITSDVIFRSLPDKNLTVNISEDDTAPVFTSTPITFINEDELYSYLITTSDDDGDIPQLSAITSPKWLKFSDNRNGTGLLRGTPTNDEVTGSPYTVIIRATDPLTTVDHPFNITVNNTNDAPLFSTTGITQATEDSPYLYNIQANDDDNDELTITAITRPTWLNFSTGSNGQAQLSGTPQNDDVGIHAVSIRVYDGTATTFQNFEITVSNTNDAPVITSTHIINATEDSEYNYTVITNDDDGDHVNITASSLPSWLTITDNGDGTALITGTPLQQNIGINAVLLRISDKIVTKYIGFEITVNNVNDAPVIIENTIPYTTPEDAPLSISFTEIAQDEDDNIDYNTIQIITQPINGTINLNYLAQTIIYTPNTGFAGTDQFTLQIEDLSGAKSNIGTIRIDVSNEAPDAVNDTYLINEDTPSTFNVLSNDTDLQNNIVPASIAITTNPVNGTALAQSDGTIQYTPFSNFNGTDNFTYSIKDDDGYSDQATVSITINPVNDAPTLEDDSETTAEDTPVTINVLNNDSDIDDTLVPSSIKIVDQPSNGAVNINQETFDITYTPVSDFNGTDVFTYSIADESGDYSQASVIITVTPVNDAPTPVDDNIETPEEISVVIWVLQNDTDLENNIDSCSVRINTSPQKGSVTKLGCGRIIYNPTPDFNGNDQFTYIITDSLGGEGEATVYINVSPVPDTPVAIADSYQTNEDTSITMDVLENDTDNDQDINISSLSIATNASNGTLEISNGEITYTPNLDFNGADSFTYQVCDNTELCATASVTITINPVNDAPVANDDNDSGIVNGSVKTNIVENDNDVDGNIDISSITVITEPQNGALEIDHNTGTITYTPNNDFEGQDQYTYRICDTNGLCDNATVYLTISTTNSRPVTQNDRVETDEDESIIIRPLDNDTDADDDLDPQTLTIVRDPQFGICQLNTSNSTIEYTPNQDYFGNDTIIYQICDSGLPQFCAVDTIFIVINSINDAPIAIEDYITVTEGESGDIDLAINDYDIESPNELLTVRISTHTPTIKGEAIILEDQRTLRFTAAYDCGCSEEVVYYTLEDGTNAIAQGKVTIYIETAPDNFPEVFTPNGDGINDFFIIPGIENNEFEKNELFIFNRWGGQVFHMKNYNNSWDGKSSSATLGGDDLPEGTYFYVFKLENGKVYKGTVYLKK